MWIHVESWLFAYWSSSKLSLSDIYSMTPSLLADLIIYLATYPGDDSDDSDYNPSSSLISSSSSSSSASSSISKSSWIMSSSSSSLFYYWLNRFLMMFLNTAFPLLVVLSLFAMLNLEMRDRTCCCLVFAIDWQLLFIE